MAGQSNAAPVIIKRKKVVQGGGHHGGAWKVAYADFVTAMMAFFMLMWLLNATTEKQRKGLADYFNPTIPINRISGGGDGAFGGDSVFAENTQAQNGLGASNLRPSEERQARGEESSTDGDETAQKESAQLELLKAELQARGGESMTMRRALRHVTSKVTDEGLVIELFDLEDAALFEPDSATPAAPLRLLLPVVAEVLGAATNETAINGHVRAYPITLIDQPAWALSANRAQAARGLLEDAGLAPQRIQRVTGYADRKPATALPTADRNNRIEIVLLRRDR